MPVPVPRAHISPPHIVNKKRHSYSGAVYSCQNSGTLQSPIGPPPSFSTRDKWSASLPTSRRAKPRRIWEDDSRSTERGIEQGFTSGLAAATNASAIKGPHAQAYIPPMYLQHSPMLSSATYPDISADSWDAVPKRSDKARSWNTRSLSLDQIHQYSTEDCLDRDLVASILSPLYAEPSPDGMSDADLSSPMQPLTPDDTLDYASRYHSSAVHDIRSDKSSSGYQLEAVPEEPVLTPAVAPTTSSSYKKLAQPLADWAADTVWKLCTGGVELPANLARQLHGPTWKHYSATPPSYLASSVHSVLLSTLLQPSAVFLAVWYIARLPVYFGNVGFNGDPAKELLFRAALLGEGQDRETMETSAPFRLMVLGFMLANKWLDDHTFSNKTWHTISNIPIQGINTLEALTLDIFSYDLTISPHEWSQWLRFVSLQHSSGSSPASVQPISRPSNNPHMVIRRLLEETSLVAVTASTPGAQPVFIGLEERRRAQLAKDESMAGDIMDIDLDEDGPLREEYMPRRRSTLSIASKQSFQEQIRQELPANANRFGKVLPPPAKWSPAGDEPILRESNRMSGQYLPVQPTPAFSTTAIYGTATCYPPEVAASAQHWYGTFAPIQSALNSCGGPGQPVFAPFPFVSSNPRVTYEQENVQSHHARSSSMSDYDNRIGRGRLHSQDFRVHDMQRSWPNHYGFVPPAYAASVAYQPVW